MADGIEFTGVTLVADHLGAFAAALRDAGKLTATIGSDVPYAPYVIHGTRHYKGNDFLTPALERGMPALTEQVGFALGAGMWSNETGGVEREFRASVAAILTDVKAHANVRTGRLRDSFTAEYGR